MRWPRTLFIFNKNYYSVRNPWYVPSSNEWIYQQSVFRAATRHMFHLSQFILGMWNSLLLNYKHSCNFTLMHQLLLSNVYHQKIEEASKISGQQFTFAFVSKIQFLWMFLSKANGQDYGVSLHQTSSISTINTNCTSNNTNNRYKRLQ